MRTFLWILPTALLAGLTVVAIFQGADRLAAMFLVLSFLSAFTAGVQRIMED